MKDINTYGDLKKAVQLWLNRKDATTLNNIDMFVNMALKSFARVVKLPYYEVLVSLEAVKGYDYVNIPQDFASAKHVMVNGIPYNRLDTESFMRLNSGTGTTTTDDKGYTAPWGFQGATTSQEHFFTRVGGQLRFIPALNEGDVVEMIYHRDIPEFKKDNEEHYLLLVASDVLLYFSLQHASIFLRDPEQEAFWEKKAMTAVSSLSEHLERAEWDGSALVVPMFHS